MHQPTPMISIVDDDASVARALRRLVGSAGYVVETFASAPEFLGCGPLIPSRNGELLRWCYSKGLRLMQQMTLMSIGLYNEPRFPFIPSILY